MEGIEDDFLSFAEDVTPDTEVPQEKQPAQGVQQATQPELPVVPPPLPVTPAKQPSAPQAPATGATAAQTQQQPVPQQPPVAPVQPQTQQQPESTEQGQPPPQQQDVGPQTAADTLDQLRQGVEQNRQVFEQALADRVYKLNETEVEQLQDDPATAVPKLLARAHVDIVRNVLGTLSAHMPGMVMGLLEAQRVNDTRETQLWEAFPQLDKVKDRQTVVQVAQVVNQLYPTLTPEQRIQQVGLYAMMQLGKVQQTAVAAQTQQPQAAHPALQRPQSIPAYRPAAAGQVPTQTMAPSPAQNPFEAMDQLMQDYEAGAFDGA